MNAITLLKEDHRTIKDLFGRYEKLGKGARKTKAKLVGAMVRELSQHSVIEEAVFYPEARARVPASTDAVLESLEEHHIVKWTCEELRTMDPSEERYDAKVTVLMENVRHHIREEEQELFPEVARVLSRKDLNEIGEALQAFRTVAPKKPHPRAPDEPPENVLAVVGAAPMDAVEQTVDEVFSSLP